MSTPGSPAEARDRSLRRTRWAIAGVAVGGAVLATGAVALVDGGGDVAAAQGPGIVREGRFGTDGSGGDGSDGYDDDRDDDDRDDDHDDDRDDDDDDDDRDDDDDDRFRPIPGRARGYVDDGRTGGSQQFGSPRQQWGGGAPQSRSRGS